MKAKVNILAKPHPYIFFTLQIDSILESCCWIFSHPCSYLMHTDYYMTSLEFTQAQDLGYTRGIYGVPLSIQTYDSIIKYMAWF